MKPASNVVTFIIPNHLFQPPNSPEKTAATILLQLQPNWITFFETMFRYIYTLTGSSSPDRLRIPWITATTSHFKYFYYNKITATTVFFCFCSSWLTRFSLEPSNSFSQSSLPAHGSSNFGHLAMYFEFREGWKILCCCCLHLNSVRNMTLSSGGKQ